MAGLHPKKIVRGVLAPSVFVAFGLYPLLITESANAACVNTAQAATVAATIQPTPQGETPTVTTLNTCGGDDVSYQVPIATTITYDGIEYQNVYATTNSVITFGRADGTYWDYPTTPSISIASIDWVVYPSQRNDEHLIINSSDGGFQVDLSARPIWNQSTSVEPTNIVVTAAINADGTVAISYVLSGPDWVQYNPRTGARLNDGTVVPLEEANIQQVEEVPVLTPEPLPSPSPTPDGSTATASPSPSPSSEPSPEPSPTPTLEPSIEPSPSPTPESSPQATPEPQPTPSQSPTVEPTPEPTSEQNPVPSGPSPEELARIENERIAAIQAERARLQAIADAQAREEELARLAAEEQAKAIEEARLKAEEERLKAEAEAKAIEEERLRLEAEAKAEEERLALIEVERLKAEELARLEAERLAAEKLEAEQMAAAEELAIEEQNKTEQEKEIIEEKVAEQKFEELTGVKPNSPDQLPISEPKLPEPEKLVPRVQVDKTGIENGGIEFFGTQSQPQVIGEDGKLTPAPPLPGSGDYLNPEAITTTETFIGQAGGVTFNAPDIAVPVLPIEINIEIPGVGEAAQAVADAYVAVANIGNDMSPVTRKKAKKILIATIIASTLWRRFGD